MGYREFIHGASLLVLIGCGIDYPIDLRIQGLPLQPMEAVVSEARIENSELLLRLVGKPSAVEVSVSPWPYRALPSVQADSIRTSSRFSPSGPSYLLELIEQGETVVLVGDGTTGALVPLPGWSATIAKPIGPDESGTRLWVTLYLDIGSDRYRVSPGRTIVIESQGRKWQFLLLGASVPNPSSPAAPPGIATEQPQLSIDWLLYALQPGPRPES